MKKRIEDLKKGDQIRFGSNHGLKVIEVVHDTFSRIYKVRVSRAEWTFRAGDEIVLMDDK
jgi:hypothetical protein